MDDGPREGMELRTGDGERVRAYEGDGRDRLPYLTERMESTWKAAHALWSALDGLVDDMGPVLLPEEPGTVTAEVEPAMPPMSTLAANLVHLDAGLTRMRYFVEETRRRLDLPEDASDERVSRLSPFG